MVEIGQVNLNNVCNKESEEGFGSQEYVLAWFECGLCGMKLTDIEAYVTHMMLTEQCVLHLCPSTTISDLLLPRFTRRKRVETDEVDLKQGLQELKARDIEVIMQATEIETGGQTRWKCAKCGLTFSRQAAVINHQRLQHSNPSEDILSNKQLEKEYQDIDVKKEVVLESQLPVKHIVAVSSKVEDNPMEDELEDQSKGWVKPTCEHCSQTFKSVKILRTHIAVVHSRDRPFHCDFEGCSQAFKTKGSLTRHLRRHTGERPFICQICGRCFRESGSLLRHQQSTVSCINKKDSQLPLYGKTKPINSSKAEKKPQVQHLKLNHMLKQENFNLNDAENKDLEESKVNLRAEVLSKPSGIPKVKQEENFMPQRSSSVVESSRPLISCKMEHSTLSPFEEEEDLDNDLLDMENADGDDTNLEDIKPPKLSLDIMRKSFTCPVCGRNYLRRSALMLHMKIHLDQLGDQCNQCGKSFANQQSLSRHLISHSSVRQFVCKICNKAFKLMSHAKGHLSSHSSSKTIPCRYCSSLFKTVSARNMHERSHSDNKAFVCFDCGKCFATKASLIRHLRTHTGEAPFQCQYCGHSFKEHGTLSRHLKHKMPCAQQVKMEKDSGDLGIRIFPLNSKVSLETELSMQVGESEAGELSLRESPQHLQEDAASLRSSVFEDDDEESITHVFLLKNKYTAGDCQDTTEAKSVNQVPTNMLNPTIDETNIENVCVDEVIRSNATSYIIIPQENSEGLIENLESVTIISS